MGDLNDLRLIKESDVFFVPLCLLVFFVLGYSIRQKYRRTELERYFMPALFLRFVFAFMYALVIEFYYGYGDTSMYYQAVLDMQRSLVGEHGMWREIFLTLKLDVTSPLYPYFIYDSGHYTNLYMMNISNYMVPRFALPFSVIFFNSYLCICFCLSFFSFAGCWRVFKMFNEMYPGLHKKFAVAILFLPSILFWGGSLLKDSICMGAMGLTVYAFYSIFLKKRKIFSSSVILFLNCTLLYYIKPYILLCLVPAFLLLLFLQFRNKIEDRTLRKVTGVLFAGLSVVIGFFALQAITQSELASQYSSEKILQTVQGIQGSFANPEGSGSGFSVGSATGSAFDMLYLFPFGLIATLFRPFPWESGNPLMLMSALEAFGFLYLTYIAFRRIGFKKVVNIVASDSTLVFCAVYSLLFAGIVGVTTTNFGALVRYKIPCIPFYLIMLFVVMDKSGKFSRKVIIHKKLF